MFQYLKDVYAVLFGRRHHWSRHQRYVREVTSTIVALDILDKRFNYPKFEQLIKSKTDPDPVLVLSAGWRSGSTLLQRLLCSSSDTFLWGEPFGDSGLLSSPASILKKFTNSWPRDSDIFQKGQNANEMKNQWIANLSPEVDDLKCSYRQFFDALLLNSLEGKEITSWGFKEVRLTSEDACFFKWIYPEAKLIFLVRNPVDAYRSYAPHKPWYVTRPELPIITPRQFALQWNHIASSFLRDYSQLGGILVKYEDLISNSATIGEIEAYTRIALDRSVLDQKITIKSEVGRDKHKLLPFEERIIKHYSEPTFSKLGYRMDDADL